MQKQLLEQINESLSEFLRNSPLKDFENNVRAIILAIFSKLDLVTREEFDIQMKVLHKTREKLEELEMTLTNLDKNTNCSEN